VVDLEWQQAEDPDPFDEVQYVVVVDRSRDRVERTVRRLETDWEGFWESGSGPRSAKDSLLFCRDFPVNRCLLPVAQGGSFYWPWPAFDKGHHVRMAQKGGRKVFRFLVAVPDLLVKSISFTPSPYITPGPDQGRISVVVSNDGSAASEAFRILVQDFPPGGAGAEWDTLLLRNHPGHPAGTVHDAHPAVEDREAGCPYDPRVGRPGFLRARTQRNQQRPRIRIRHHSERVIDAPDSVEVMVTGYSNLEVPMVPEVYFDANSSSVPETYSSQTGVFPSLLPTLVKRLSDNRKSSFACSARSTRFPERKTRAWPTRAPRG